MNCNVIRDLMPMHVEKLTSEASNELIEEHIKECSECREMLHDMKRDILRDGDGSEILFDKNNDIPSKLINRIKRNLYQKLGIVGIVAIIIGVVMGILGSNVDYAIGRIVSLSLLIFAISTALSLLIANRGTTTKKRFSVLWKLNFVITIPVSFLICGFVSMAFINVPGIKLIIVLEIIYNIIFSITIIIYSRIKLSKVQNGVSQLDVTKVYNVTLATILSIIVLVTVPAVLLEMNKRVDNVNLPFVNDTSVIGKWVSVATVKNKADFKLQDSKEQSDFFLKSIDFQGEGVLNEHFNNTNEKYDRTPWLTWTKGYVLNNGGDKSAYKYEIREINGQKYMFYEWKSGDYMYFHTKPVYYVLIKK